MEPQQIKLFEPPEPPARKRLRDPAQAAAIAKCLMYSIEPGTRLTQQAHPERCKWCDYAFDKKLAALREFNEWAGWGALDRPPGLADPDWPELEPTVEAFMRLPLEEQQVLVEKAAGYAPGTYRKNTGYEYPDSPAEDMRNTSASQGNSKGKEESVTDERNEEPRQRRGRGVDPRYLDADGNDMPF